MTSQILPARDAFLRSAKTGNIIPVFQEIVADTETPISAFMKLNGSAYSFLLESVEGGEKWGRYSFMGFEPSFIFRSKGNKVSIQKGNGAEEHTVEDPVLFLQECLSAYRPATIEGLPRFYGGAVGYLGYETVRFFEPVPDSRKDDLEVPDTWFVVPKLVVIFDNLKQSIKVVYNTHLEDGQQPSDAYKEAVIRVASAVERLRGPLIRERIKELSTIRERPDETANSPLEIRNGEIRNKLSRQEFESIVLKAKEYIHAGDIIQVVLSQGFDAEATAQSFDIYRALRRINPSPYLFYLRFDDTALLGSSPEVMVRLEDRRVTIRPIAGTRPRGKTEEQDKNLESELLADPKERAEHVMLVDLARNDVGRVSEYGTVQLTELMAVERYSHVMHIVSNVEGTLKEGRNAFDVLRASFPAGTVSGAPKVRAMEIIHELEPHRRGPYAGAVGYFGFGGNMDLAITIRAIVVKDGRARIQAGAGIVADSDPGREYEETVHKGTALFEAVRMAASGLE